MIKDCKNNNESSRCVLQVFALRWLPELRDRQVARQKRGGHCMFEELHQFVLCGLLMHLAPEVHPNLDEQLHPESLCSATPEAIHGHLSQFMELALAILSTKIYEILFAILFMFNNVLQLNTGILEEARAATLVDSSGIVHRDCPARTDSTRGSNHRLQQSPPIHCLTKGFSQSE